MKNPKKFRFGQIAKFERIMFVRTIRYYGEWKHSIADDFEPTYNAWGIYLRCRSILRFEEV